LRGVHLRLYQSSEVDVAEKTHEPTAKRLREARRKGDVARAPLVAGALGFAVALALLPGVVEQLGRLLQSALARLDPALASGGGATDAIAPWWVARTLIALVTPFALGLVAVSVGAAIGVGGIPLATSRLAPDPSRLDALGGLRNVLDRQRAWGAARGLLVVAALAVVLGRAVLEAMRLGRLGAGDAASVLAAAGHSARRVLVLALAIAAVGAVLDAIVSLRLHRARLKMTREEVMREHKEGEGDPEVKRRREELHHELLAAEATNAVRGSTVVVINPTHLACALLYRGGRDAHGDADADEAPTLLAKGEGALAARMVEAARAYGVPVVRDVPVARALFELEHGTQIPEALYEAVAEVLRAAWEG
jgi:type III secretion protein U